MSANLENSAVATGLEKVSFNPHPKDRQCQRMFKLLHNGTHLTCQQSNAQNSPSKASTVCEARTSRCSSWILKRQRNQRSNFQHLLYHLSYADDTTLMAESKEELKSLLIKVKEESEKADLKLNIQKTKIMASSPITSWE